MGLLAEITREIAEHLEFARGGTIEQWEQHPRVKDLAQRRMQECIDIANDPEITALLTED